MATAGRMDLVWAAAKANTKALYWIYDTITTWFPANGYANKLEIAFSDSVAGDWLSETGPNDNAYIVIQPNAAYPWADASRWQLLITARNTAGASTVGGVGGALAIPSNQLYTSFSVNGGWNDVTKKWTGPFGGAAGSVAGTTWTVTPPTQFSIIGTDHLDSMGVVDGPVLTIVGLRSAVPFGFTAGRMTPHDSVVEVYPAQYLFGRPATNTVGWGDVTGVYGTFPNTAFLGEAAAYTRAIDSVTSLNLTRTGKWAGRPVELLDVTAGRSAGYLTGVFGGERGVADGSQDALNKYRMFGGLMFQIS